MSKNNSIASPSLGGFSAATTNSFLLTNASDPTQTITSTGSCASALAVPCGTGSAIAIQTLQGVGGVSVTQNGTNVSITSYPPQYFKAEFNTNSTARSIAPLTPLRTPTQTISAGVLSIINNPSHSSTEILLVNFSCSVSGTTTGGGLYSFWIDTDSQTINAPALATNLYFSPMTNGTFSVSVQIPALISDLYNVTPATLLNVCMQQTSEATLSVSSASRSNIPIVYLYEGIF